MKRLEEALQRVADKLWPLVDRSGGAADFGIGSRAVSKIKLGQRGPHL